MQTSARTAGLCTVRKNVIVRNATATAYVPLSTVAATDAGINFVGVENDHLLHTWSLSSLCHSRRSDGGLIMDKRYFILKLGKDLMEYIEVESLSPRIIAEHSPPFNEFNAWYVHTVVLDENGLRQIATERWC